MTCIYISICHIYMSIMYMIDRYITSTSTAHQSIQMQEACGGRSGVMLRALGWEEGVPQQHGAREAGAESLLCHTIVLGKRVHVVQAC